MHRGLRICALEIHNYVKYFLSAVNTCFFLLPDTVNPVSVWGLWMICVFIVLKKDVKKIVKST